MGDKISWSFNISLHTNTNSLWYSHLYWRSETRYYLYIYCLFKMLQVTESIAYIYCLFKMLQVTESIAQIHFVSYTLPSTKQTLKDFTHKIKNPSRFPSLTCLMTKEPAGLTTM